MSKDKKPFKTVGLSITERLKALEMLNGFKGSLERVAVILEDIKQFTVTKDEWVEVDGSIDQNGNQLSYNWKIENEKPEGKEINLQDVTVDYLREEIKRRNNAGEFGVMDIAFLSLLEKLG